MGGVWERSFRILRASWDVLRQDKELLVLPLLAMLCMVLAAIPLLGGVASIGHVALNSASASHGLNAVQWLLLAIYYVGVYAIGIFFSSAVVAAATIRLQGGDPTLGEAFGIAFSKIHKILGWAVVSATVGLVCERWSRRRASSGASPSSWWAWPGASSRSSWCPCCSTRTSVSSDR